jgi:hypothetical protein
MPTPKKGAINAEFIEIEDGTSVDLSSGTNVRIRANSGSGFAEVSAFGGAYAALGLGGLASIPVGGTIFVDAVNGNDGTGTADRQDLPFLTVGAALAVASSGDLVEVGPGTYTEQGLTVPPGVLLRGSGWTVTKIGDNAGTANILTMGADSAIEGITAIVPAGAFAGIVHTAGTGSVVAVNIQGTGTTGSGWGIYKLGTGKLIGGNIRCELGGLNSYLLVNSGVLALDDVHLPQSAGAIAAMVSVLNNGVFQCQGLNVGNSNCTNAILLGGTGTPVARIYSPNIFNVTNAVHFLQDGVSLTLIGGRIGNVTLSVLIDPALTGTGTIVRTLGTVLEPTFSFPPSAAANTDFALQFNQEKTNVRDSRQRLIGADLSLGFPELGSGISVGKGEPYSANIKVVTSDSTATSTTLGGNLTDETIAAESTSGSTFSFQGSAANHCIYIASIRLDAASNPLKHWGHVLNQVLTGLGATYACEVWDGGAWREVGAMANSTAELYRYANNLFQRANSEESVRLGINNSTTWSTISVDGVTAYWVRYRVITPSGSGNVPSFERVRLEESSARINMFGQRTASGLARWQGTLVAAGNIWSEDGTVTNANPSIGSGGGNTQWNHLIENSVFSSTADILYFQFTLPRGLDTSFPLSVSMFYVPDSVGTDGDDFVISVLPIEVEGNLVADPAGSVAPVARSLANVTAFDTYAGQAFVQTANFTDPSKVQRMDFGPYDISSYYEDDLCALRLTIDTVNAGSPNTDLWGIVVEGVFCSDGKGLS